MPQKPKSFRKVLARCRTLAEIYELIPKVDCKRRCGADYCGPIGMAPIEAEAIKSAGKSFPTVQESSVNGPATCGALSAWGTCLIYEQRPFICRVFGALPDLKCNHGCEPERWLTQQEADLIRKTISRLKPGADIYTVPDRDASS